jgi:hypothetical protein
MNAKKLRKVRNYLYPSHLSFADLAKKLRVSAVKRFFSKIFIYFSTKSVNFVWLLPYWIVFALVYVQSEKLKPTAEHY